MRLIENWRQKFFGFWVVRIQLVAAFVTGLMWIDPSTVLMLWNMMPDSVQVLLPGSLFRTMGAILFFSSVLTMIARNIKQPKLETANADKSKQD